MLETLKGEPWANLGTTNITVQSGVVEFWGSVGSEEELTASRVAAESIAGVKRVVDHRAVRPLVVTTGV